MRRVLKPGGVAAILEFSQPPNPLFAALYGFYSRRMLPAVGGLISGSRDDYAYLPESVRKFPGAERLAEEMRAAGFAEVSFERMTFGIVALHLGRARINASAWYRPVLSGRRAYARKTCSRLCTPGGGDHCDNLLRRERRVKHIVAAQIRRPSGPEWGCRPGARRRSRRGGCAISAITYRRSFQPPSARSAAQTTTATARCLELPRSFTAQNAIQAPARVMEGSTKGAVFGFARGYL